MHGAPCAAERTLASDAPLQQDARTALRELNGAERCACSRLPRPHPEHCCAARRRSNRDPYGIAMAALCVRPQAAQHAKAHFYP